MKVLLRIVILIICSTLISAGIIALKWFVWDTMWGYSPEFEWKRATQNHNFSNPDAYYAIAKFECTDDTNIDVEFKEPNASFWKIICFNKNYDLVSEINSEDIKDRKQGKIKVKVKSNNDKNEQNTINCKKEESHNILMYYILDPDKDFEKNIDEKLPDFIEK